MRPVLHTIVAFLLLLSSLQISPARAEPGLVPDLRLLVDVSENMEKFDPGNLRSQTLEMVIRLLPAGTRVGVWVFAEEARELVPSGIVDQGWRAQALEALSDLEYSGSRTNIPAALEAATADLPDLEPGYRSSVVLVTAGTVNVADSPMINVSAARKLLSGLAKDLGARGVPVHTIALTRHADSLLLRSLARETGGTSEHAEDVSELGVMFLKVIEMVVPVAREPLYEREFSVDERTDQFVVFAVFPRFRGKLTLLAPDGTAYSANENPGDILWFQNRQFNMARVSNPVVGNWRLQYPPKTAARVYVESDLTLEVGYLPYYTSAGHEAEVTARLNDAGETVTDPQVLASYNLLLDVTSPQGNTQRYRLDAPSEDGLFRATTPPLELPGRYRLMLRLEGAGGLERELPIYMEVGVPTEQPTLVTRGEESPEDDFQSPLVWLTGVMTLILLLVWYILRRRKRRKLALWQKRAREMKKSGGQDTLRGTLAVAEEQSVKDAGSLD
ncbi:VWA domain-containing protein [Seongchinamella unica]|uniref:VWA domain-containing protein n=1 Tax=Seongchinamella unica TaxID=2547392 RepID=A0A4R5LS74_9GAMM|nr:vWA domain-containing protein [Seongchinamella unica]TDG13749.1 VWA domain-containing protein [Seongchinamella unica]